MTEGSQDLRPIGKYRLLRELGRGSSGIVYEAFDTTLDRRVALKVFAENPLATAVERSEDQERFLREAKVTASIPKHPSIVGLYEANLHDGKRFIAMEFIEGESLADWCETPGIDLRKKVEVLRDAALAVNHAHEHAVIHRDLKPGNILIDPAGKPHLTDFGLAKRVGADVSLTGGGLVVGTPHYMSPEQAQGLKTLDHRTDIYSLGIILYEFLAGRRPFEGDSAMEIMMKAVRTTAPSPTSVMKETLPEVARGLDKICLKAIAKRPDERYSSAHALADDLSAWLRGETVKVRNEKTARPLAPRPARSRKPFWAAIALALAVGAVAIAYSVLGGRETPTPPPPPIPAAPAYEPGAIGEYYLGWEFQVLVLRKIDPNIDFDWTGKSAWLSGPTENFSARWQGYFLLPKGGPIDLLVRSDDGARLSVDGKEVLNHWTPHPPTLDAIPLSLEKGVHRFLLDYHQGIGEAVIQLAWKHDGAVVPLSLFHKASDYRPLELPQDGVREDVPGAQEGPSLKILEGEGTIVMDFGWPPALRRGRWSGTHHLWWGTKVKVGDRLRLAFYSPEAGKKTLVLGLLKAKDYGIHRISVNGAVLASQMDFYDPGMINFRAEFRDVELKAGVNELEVVALGSNPLASEWRPKSGLYKFGLNFILVK